MRTIFCLLSFFQFVTIDLIAQQDSLNPQNKLQILKTDSLPSFTVTMPDSVIINPSLYFPMTMGPWTIDPSIDLSSIYVSSIVFESPYTSKGARKDIELGKPVILFSGGFAGIPDFNSEADKIFQKKYNVIFYSKGCIRMSDDDQEAYNQVIFDYLDKKFGDAWRFELREDAIGFEAPKLVIPKLSTLALQIANSANPLKTESMNLDPETSIWWYVLPTSGFALLLSLYLIKRKKD
jgi:hypothetical protein